MDGVIAREDTSAKSRTSTSVLCQRKIFLKELLGILVFIVVMMIPALGDGADNAIYKKKIKLPHSNPMYRLFPDAEQIYEVEYTEEYRRALEEYQQGTEAGASLIASGPGNFWINPLCLSRTPDLFSPDRNRISFLWDGVQDWEIVDVALNSKIRWYFAEALLPESGAPVYTWWPVNMYVDEYVEWTRPGESQPTGYELQNALQLNVASGCQGAGYWDHYIPDDAQFLGIYDFIWMYGHADPSDHPHMGPAVLDYLHGGWFKMRVRIYSSTTAY